MGLFDVFSKGGKYFGKAIEPKCEYCESGKRAKDGDKVLCQKKGLVDAGYHCPKFVYSPLKRIPEKQMSRVGFLEGDYDEKDDHGDGSKQKKNERGKNGKLPRTVSLPSEKKDAAPADAPAKTDSAAPAEKAAEPVNAAADTAKEAADTVKAVADTAKAAADKAAEAVKPAAEAAADAVKTAAAAVKPAGGSDLAALAAMAEAAGDYQPEPSEAPADAPAEDQPAGGSPTLSSM